MEWREKERERALSKYFAHTSHFARNQLCYQLPQKLPFIREKIGKNIVKNRPKTKGQPGVRQVALPYIKWATHE